RELSWRPGIISAEGQKLGRLKIPRSPGENPIRSAPGPSLISGPCERMAHVGPSSVLQIDGGVENMIYKSQSGGFAFFRKRRRVLRIFPAIHIDTAPPFAAAFNAREAHRHTPIRIRAAKTATVPPRP